jgi:hypothetical protein
MDYLLILYSLGNIEWERVLCDLLFSRDEPLTSDTYSHVHSFILSSYCRQNMALPDKILARKLMKKEKKKLRLLQEKAKKEQEGTVAPGTVPLKPGNETYVIIF